MQKNAKRLFLVTSNTLRQVLKAVFGFTIAYLVINFVSKTVWGSFVSYLLFVLFSEQVISWGNKEYLLRSFSLTPSKINQKWTSTLIVRFPLVLLFSLLSVLIFNNLSFLFIFFWLFGRFLTQSTQPLIIYSNKYLIAIFIEIISFLLFLGLFFYTKEKLTVLLLIKIIGVYHFVKGLIYIISFSSFLSFKKNTVSLHYFKVTFPFFLMAIIGFIASRIDLYLVDFFEDNNDIANYQIYNSALILFQSLAIFICTPFIKNIYRIDNLTTKKIQNFLVKIGLVIVPIQLIIFAEITKLFFNFKIPIRFLLLGFIIVFPSFYFCVSFIRLFKFNKEKLVVKIIAITILSNLLVSGLLIYNNHGVLSVLIGSAFAQVVMSYLIKRASNQITLKSNT